jgi:hypothetical protein
LLTEWPDLDPGVIWRGSPGKVTGGCIPIQAILAALDADRAAQAEGCDMPLLRDRGDRPGLLGGRDRRDHRGDRRDDRQDWRRRGPGLFR